MKLFVDTNVFLRFLTGDNPTQAEQARNFLDQAVDDTDVTLITSDPVIMELVYTLRSFYGVSEEKSASNIETILGFCQVVRPASGFDWHQVFAVEQESQIDFIDAVNYLIMINNEIETIVTFNTDFDRLEEIIRQPPSSVI